MLSIQYKNNHDDNLSIYRQNYVKPFRAKAKYRFEWKLSEKEMKKFKDSEIDATLYSSNFNGNCCCVVLIPCGVSWSDGTKGYLYAKIKMVKTFIGISKMVIDGSFIVRYDNGSNFWSFSTENHPKKRDGGIGDESIKIPFDKLVNDNDNLTVIMNMEIVRVYDDDKKLIEKEQWRDYGIDV